MALLDERDQTGTSLDEYLGSIATRLRAAVASRGAGAMAATALASTAICVYLANRAAFSEASVVGSRVFLLLALLAAAVGALVLPLRRLLRSPALRRAADEAERRSPEFGGRLRTWADEHARAKAAGRSPSPLLALLARETSRSAAAVPLDTVVSRAAVAAFAAAAGMAVLCLVWLGTAGPGYWQYGTARLWAGWLVPQGDPLYELLVEPGDATIREGGRLDVTASVVGFEPGAVRIHAKFESSVDWETAPMGPQLQGSGYEFGFSAVREPLRYYVEAGRMRSREFVVGVVSMPHVENIRLEYEYPDWSGLDPHVQDPGGDIAAVRGTRVTVTVSTDKELEGGLLVVGDGEEVGLLRNAAEIEVGEDSTYHVAATYRGESVRLTDDYFITAVPDQKPVVEILEPGRDWRASSIEEVAVSIEASDDFGLRGVELRYAVNGVDEQTVRLSSRRGAGNVARRHVFYLEEFGPPGGVAELPDPGSGEELPPPAPEAGLIPGDLISYYVVARDAKREVRSDMYFINVQPYERRFSQSQQAGGQGGQGQRQDEISRRQKEIILATWNLINERDAEDGREERKLRESATMLSELQGTLMQQAQTLAQRTRARQLTETDPMFAQFVEYMEQAAAFMEPAAEALHGFRLEDAVGPEQQALQFLLRAENLFTDIQISMSQGRGGGGGASRDLAEMFELEMDLEKNQYETGGGASGQQVEQEIDEAMKKLEELARRQEQLADRAQDRSRAGFEQRWQQEMLRREAEDLRRQLEQLQRRQESSRRQQAGAQGAQGSQGQGSSQGGRGSRQQLDRAIEQLRRASQEMERGSQGGDPRSASAGALRELQRAVDLMEEQRRQQSASALDELARESAQLVEDQERAAQRLQESLRVALEALKAQGGRQNGPLPTGMTREEEIELSDLKSDMGERVGEIEKGLQRQARALRGRNDDASRALLNALMELQQSEASPTIQYAADLIRRGLAPYAASNEEAVSRALRRLRDDIQKAGQIAREERGGDDRGLARMLSEVERLRRGLEDAAAAGRDEPTGEGRQPGEGRQGRQEGGQQAGSGAGEPRRDGQAAGPAPGRGDRRGGRASWGWSGDRRWRGGFPPITGNPDVAERMERALEESLAEVPSLARSGRAQREFDPKDIEDLRNFARELGDGRFRGNPELLEEEYRRMLALLEQLEVKLRRQVELDDKEEVRAIVSETVPEPYREAVAEYYRRLGRAR
ncbi:MAG: hypothetical protein OXN97_24580 [Bryobacterales bacterium]|nr:hypothetical protein [Bryobacterales bacterium]MDE0625249.1 hypothetical protein [Bryobacterales bacterium]